MEPNVKFDGKKFPNVGIFNISFVMYVYRGRYSSICKFINSAWKTHIVIADKRVLSDKGKITNSNITLSKFFVLYKKEHFGENANKGWYVAIAVYIHFKQKAK